MFIVFESRLSSMTKTKKLLTCIQLRNVLPIAIGLLLLACQNEAEKQRERLQSDLTTYFKANMMDSTASLDSFRLIQIDTVTQRMLLYEQFSILNNQVGHLVDLYKLSNQKLSLSLNQMRLYRMLESKDLIDIEKNDFNKEKEKGDKIRHEIDTLMSLTAKIDSLAKVADTIKPIGFEAQCFFQLRRKDKSVERDTVFILLNLNKDIIDRTDFLKLPYSVNFDKLR